MTLLSGRKYQFRINNVDGDLNSVSATVDNFYFWSPDIFESADNFKAVNIPQAEGGTFRGKGYRKARTVSLIGTYTGYVQSDNEQYPNKHIYRYLELVQALDRYRDTDLYIEVETKFGTGSIGTRRWLFVKPLRQKFIPVEGTQYTASKSRFTFLAADPDFYSPSLTTASASGSAGSASAFIANNIYPTQRLTIKIENVDGSSITNPTASSMNIAGAYWTISGSITGAGDYWIVDHHAGTVKQIVGGVETNVVSAFSGCFFPLVGESQANIIKASITSGDSNSLKLTLSARKKMDWDD